MYLLGRVRGKLRFHALRNGAVEEIRNPERPLRAAGANHIFPDMSLDLKTALTCMMILLLLATMALLVATSATGATGASATSAASATAASTTADVTAIATANATNQSRKSNQISIAVRNV